MTADLSTLPAISGCRVCGETIPAQRHQICDARTTRRMTRRGPVVERHSHDWYEVQFAICRETPARPGWNSTSEALCGGRRVGWSTHGYTTFGSLADAQARIAALGLVDVDIRRVEFPLAIVLETAPVVWPEAAKPAGIERAALRARRDEEHRLAAASAPPRDPIGDPDAWYGDRSD